MLSMSLYDIIPTYNSFRKERVKTREENKQTVMVSHQRTESFDESVE